MKGPTGFDLLLEMAWATHEGLRRLGFAADNIFVLTTEANELFVQLKTQGKEFNVRVGQLGDLTRETFEDCWPKFVDRINGGEFSDDLLHRIFDHWLEHEAGGAMPLINAIMSKGIKLPKAYRGLS